MFVRLTIRATAKDPSGLFDAEQRIRVFAEQHGWFRTEKECFREFELGIADKDKELLEAIKAYETWSWIDYDNYDWPTQTVEMVIR